MTDIKGYEKLYAITSCGKVYSHRSEKFLKSRLNKDGYCEVKLWKNGKCKTFCIHRLVGENLIPNPNNYKVINHKDENKTNNCINNLEWCTTSYNNSYGTRMDRIKNKLHKKVKCIETGIIYNSVLECANAMNLKKDSLSQVCRGERKILHGYHFIYI